MELPDPTNDGEEESPIPRADAELALNSFREWSNYLLVTTVAALGWIATSKGLPPFFATVSILMLTLSIGFAVLTLALLPHIAQQLGEGRGIYETVVQADYRPHRRKKQTKPKPRPTLLKEVCWPQHITFLLGIAAYAVAGIYAAWR